MIIPAHTSEAKTVPFIREVPIIGSLRNFTHDQLRFFERLAAEGDICGFHMGPITMILLNKAEYVQSVMVEYAYDYFSKSRISRRFTQREALFFSLGNTHRQRRKVMAPMFQPRHITHYADTIVQYAEERARSWNDKENIDIKEQMADLTMSIIVKVLFDVDNPRRVSELLDAFVVGYKHTARRTRSFTLPESWPTAYNRHVHEAKSFLDHSIDAMILERRGNQPEDPQISNRLDMLSVLSDTLDEDGNRVSSLRIIDEFVALIGAGYETTMAALSWTWYFLCENPEIYKQVQQEVQDALQGQKATVKDLARLPLCLQVFKEAMRIYPPVPFILRETLEDVTIDGYRIPKGASLLVSPYTMHRKAEYFPDPYQFNPDRFSAENERLQPRNAYLPFGAGPQICIGNHFVLMMGQLLVATLAQHVTFSLIPGQHVAPDPSQNITLCPNGKLAAVVQKNA
ncbi:cytochrome P450 [Dictyobacter arantiisoli]|uniref:Cytochrome P450 n=1 Tax=Dictyobacter arantiisoli TaxID=2014874 RepID=A0A5A5T6W3_9CHLR|nr:cytochrome P450 [Dictyobacter arantiisoli]GCF07137.1 cytochrome P450 [Dictyobacter arantiisoli]